MTNTNLKSSNDMIRQIQFNFSRRPAWQRFLLFVGALIVTATLFWIGLIFFLSFALIALGVMAVSRLKYKLTGRPLFTGPEQFSRRQSQFKKDNIIEGEIIDRDKD